MSQPHRKDNNIDVSGEHVPYIAALVQTGRIRDVTKITGLSESTIYRLVSAGKFPKPFKLSARINLWVIPEVIDHMKKLIEER